MLKKLRDGANSHFDPEMIEAFFANLETIHAIADHYQNNERLSSPEGPGELKDRQDSAPVLTAK